MNQSQEEAIETMETACNLLNWHVFACYSARTDGGCTCRAGRSCPKPGKHPATFNGFKDAVCHQDAVRHIMLYGNERNVAVACEKSRVLVFDIDPRHGGHLSFESLKQLTHLSEPQTIEALTGNYFVDGRYMRGRHLYFEVPEGASFVANLPEFPGIDFKHKGYVIAPPSIHYTHVSYEWLDGHSPEDIEIQPLPVELVSLLNKDAGPTRSVQETISDDVFETLNAQPFGSTARTALSELVGEIRLTKKGNRNNQTFKSAAKVASWASAGCVPFSEALNEVAEACIETGLSEKEVIDTIIRAVPYGLANPEFASAYEPWMYEVAMAISNPNGSNMQ